MRTKTEIQKDKYRKRQSRRRKSKFSTAFSQINLQYCIKTECILPILNLNIVFYAKPSFNKIRENHCLVNSTHDNQKKQMSEVTLNHFRQVADKASYFMRKLVKILIMLSLGLFQPNNADSVNVPCAF